MRMKKGGFALAVLLTTAMVLTLGCGGAGGSKQPSPKSGGDQAAPKLSSVVIATASSGGAWYPIGGALGDLTGKYAGIRGTPQVTAGAAENARLVASGKAELGFVSSETLLPAYRGDPPFTNERLDNLRSVMSVFPLELSVITLKNAPFEKFTDLKGKKVGVGPPGSGTQIGAEALCKAYGMSFKDIQAMPLGFSDMYDGVADGSLDAMILMATNPVSGCLNLATMKPIRLIPIADVVDAMVKENPQFFNAVIKGGMYPGVADDYVTVAGATVLVTNSAVDDQSIYQITKAILQHVREYDDAHPLMKMVTFDSALNGVTVPLHPGAEKYYTEANHPSLKDAPKK